eukprot:maker-scaffold1538_size36768-snap-gene-0.8 protein:Tk08902 transcript:maker-scaffold1538_size36768-snap-gene-0.8-mRNA-1 annotation:"hypothetical protein DAPPUDRAFT_315465"
MSCWRSLRRDPRKPGQENRRFPIWGTWDSESAVSSPTHQSVFGKNGIKTAKYSIFTFLPKNLFEQFRRIANFYFLIVGVVQLGIESPVSPFTSIAPLVFVVLVTMIKQGYEDYLRHKADSVINNRKVTRIKKCGESERIQSKKIEVGDILRIEDDEDFPCDILLLSTSSSQGKCYVMTANLDGETNLKTKKPASITNAIFPVHQSVAATAQSIFLETDFPCAQLETFHGNLYIIDREANGSVETSQDESQNSCVLTSENLLLRGSRLKNTDSVIGCAVFTGADTKMSLNGKLTSNKFSTVEKKMNRYLVFFLLLLAFEVVVSVILKYTVAIDYPDAALVPWYIGGQAIRTNVKQVAQDFLSFLVLFNYIIPISLYVTLEVQKFFGSLFFVWDAAFFDERLQKGAICNSSDLNEDLGQVDILFSDKTGTLTENIMSFHSCSVDGSIARSKQCFDSNFVDDTVKEDFFETLSLCHTVEITEHKGKLVYNASSPDEKALVEACKTMGIAFLEETFDQEANEVLMKVCWEAKEGEEAQTRVYKRLQVLEFDSDRKRMSVIVERSDGSIWVLSKGADSSILPICTSGPAETTAEHVNEFAMDGLRTLLVARRQLTREELETFNRNLREAQQASADMAAMKQAAFATVESNLVLLGAVAIEDELQDGVKETLTALRQAGIRVWVLTGDKKETAVNISYSSGHIFPNCGIIDLTAQDGATLANALEAGMTKRKADLQGAYCLIVDGATIFHILPQAEYVHNFRELAKLCVAVLCCRMSPLQKADVVKMMKQDPSSPVTAAVGDGANDVSMLQEAHVGLGITGREGRAAARASDFAVSRFRHLQRVFLVHGYWYYQRVAILVQYSFYKNVMGFTPQLFWAFFNSYSTQTLYDSLSLTLYNIVYTCIPIFVYSLMEQDKSESELLSRPETYKDFSRNRLLRMDKGAVWFVEALLHAVMVFFFTYGVWAFGGLEDGHGHELGRAMFGQAVYQSAIVVASIRILMESRYWNWIFIASILLSVAAYYLLTVMTQLVVYPSFLANLAMDQSIADPIGPLPLNLDQYQGIVHLGSALDTWLLMLLLGVSTVLPILVTSAVAQLPRETFYRSNLDYINKGFEMT